MNISINISEERSGLGVQPSSLTQVTCENQEGRRKISPKVSLWQNSCEDWGYEWAVTDYDQSAHPQLFTYSFSFFFFKYRLCLSIRIRGMFLPTVSCTIVVLWFICMYVFGHSDNWNICLRYIWFSATVASLSVSYTPMFVFPASPLVSV